MSVNPVARAQDVRAAQIAQFCQNLPTALGSGVLLAVLLSATLWEGADHRNLLLWVAGIVAISGVRGGLWRQWRARRQSAAEIVLALSMPMRATSIAAGLVWGSTTLYLFQAHDTGTQMLLAFVLAGITAGATTSMAADRFAAVGFQLAVLVPLAARMAVEGGREHLGMCLMTTLYLAFLVATVLRLHRQITDGILMRAEAQRRESALRESEQRYRNLAHTDSLTGLPNRHALHQLLPDLLPAAGKGAPVALLYLDVDNFKDLNDTHGHGFGDRTLLLVAERLRLAVRHDDIVARMGGDEFVIVAPQIRTRGDAEALAGKVLQALSEPAEVDTVSVRLGASIGIGLYPEDGWGAEELLKRADIALYQAKMRGRARFHSFTPDMDDSLRERLFLEKALRAALGNDELFVEYQPLIDLQQNRPPELETLLRWRHPQRGLLSPAKFIPIAEHYGLMESLGEYVLRSVCRQLRDWHADMVPLVPVAINVSPRQFDGGRLSQLVERTTAEFGVDPSLLHIEITESALMQHSGNVIETLHRLRALGVRISVDDFGTGYSSLSYLKNLPIDCLKIDRSFIHDMTRDPRDVALVRGIIGIAKSLSMRVVAEGVETQRQAEMLRALGCELAQGYYFHRPMSAARCAALLIAAPSAPSFTETLTQPHLKRLGASA